MIHRDITTAGTDEEMKDKAIIATERTSEVIAEAKKTEIAAEAGSLLPASLGPRTETTVKFGRDSMMN